jgi:hypothetical protein
MAKKQSSKRQKSNRTEAKSREKRSALPKLQWDGSALKAEIKLPAWRGFKTRVTAPWSKGKSPGQITVEFDTPDFAPADPTPQQVRAYEFLVKKQVQVRSAILQAIMDYYPEVLTWFDGEDIWQQQMARRLPKQLTRPEQLKSLIRMTSIYVCKRDRSGMAYVGYAFDCTWDEEHGLGMTTHGKRILKVGEGEEAFGGSAEDELRALRKARGWQSMKVPEQLDPEDINEAIIEGNRKWVVALLKAGAPPDKKYFGAKSATAIDQAVYNNEPAILKMLLKRRTRPLDDRLLRSAAACGYLEVFKILRKSGLKPNEKHLTDAVTERHTPMVRYLLSLGLKPEPKAILRAAGVFEPHYDPEAPRGVDRSLLRMLKKAGAQPPDAKAKAIFDTL